MRRRTSVLLLLLLSACGALDAGPIQIQGRVLLPDKTPAVKVEVALLPYPDPFAAAKMQLTGSQLPAMQAAVTDRDGSFMLRSPGPGVWLMQIRADGFVPLEAILSPLIEDISLPDAVLIQDVGANVSVTDSESIAKAQAVVLLVSQPDYYSSDSFWMPARQRWGKTDASGRLRLPAGSTESFTLSALAAGRSLSMRESARAGQAVFQLQPVGTTVLKIVDEKNQPLTGVLVRDKKSGLPLGLSDSNGKMVPGLKNPMMLELFSPGGSDRAFEFAPSATETTVKMPSVVTLTGRVIDARGRATVAGAIVWASGRRWNVSVTDSQGRFLLTGPAGSSDWGHAAAANYVDETIRDFQYRTRPLTIALEPGSLIHGTVVDDQNHPVEHAEIEVFRGMGMGVTVYQRFGTPALAYTDARGQFHFSRLYGRSPYKVVAKHKQYPAAFAEISPVEAGVTRPAIKIILKKGITVQGTVVDQAESPLKDASVRFSTPRDMQAMADDESLETIEAATDASGRFQTDRLPAGPFDVEVRHAGFASKKLPAVEIAATGKPVDLGKIKLSPGTRLQGHVMSTARQPIQGADVFMETPDPLGYANFDFYGAKPSAVSGPDGYFQISDLQPGERVNLEVRRPGYAAAQLQSVPVEKEVQVTLLPSSRVSGTVMNQRQEPVPGSDLSLAKKVIMGSGTIAYTTGRSSGKSDQDGRFVFKEVKPDKYSLYVTADGYQARELDAIQVAEGKDVTDLKVVLQYGATVEGTVTGPDGFPITGAQVQPVNEDKRPFFQISRSSTDGDGYYRLTGLAPGLTTIQAQHQEQGRAVKDIELQSGTNKLDLIIDSGLEISGKVADETGAPIEGASVYVLGSRETSSQPDGTFRLRGITNGEHQLWVDKQGYASSRDEVKTKVDGKSVYGILITLKKGGSIFGALRGLSGSDFSTVGISAEQADGLNWPQTRPDSQGNYRLANLAPGRWYVIAMQQGTGKQASDYVVLPPDGQEAKLDLQFGKGLVLSGIALLGQTPMTKAAVIASGKDTDSNGYTETDFEGHFRIDGLQPGSYKVEVSDWEKGIRFPQEIDLQADREITIQIPETSLAGSVVDALDRSPIAGALLQLKRQTGADRQAGGNALTDSEGKFELTNIVAGNWNLYVQKTGYAVLAQDLEVAQNGNADLNLELQPTEGLYLQPKLPGGQAPGDVWLALVDAQGNLLVSGNYQPGENGMVRVSTAPPGTWDMIISGGGSAYTTVPRVVVPGQPMNVVLVDGGNLKVQVPELAEEPILAKIQMSDPDGSIHRFVSRWLQIARTEQNIYRGEVLIEQLPAGKYGVKVTAPDGRQWQKEVQVQAGTTNLFSLP